jgi:hypothetical protein
MERVTVLAVRTDYIARSREQASLLIVEQRKKDVWSTESRLYELDLMGWEWLYEGAIGRVSVRRRLIFVCNIISFEHSRKYWFNYL